ncbi:hypothetical protein PHAVU_L001781 [Phaseolus vulgaris]|uniref:Uncharacterized protein n=2 Tax=Phaseolus vulgaris TaxID=3885 RepID=A0ACC3P106_PHAVU
MLSDPSAALSIVFDQDGDLDLINGKCYIDMSTVDTDTSSKISEAIKAKGGYFLEAPVSGSKKPAEDGQLVIHAAGCGQVFCWPLEIVIYWEKMCMFYSIDTSSVEEQPSYLTFSKFIMKVENGAKMKLVVNMIMGSMMNAFSEGHTLAERSGLNPATLLEVLDIDVISNGMFKLKGPTMLQNSYSPAFPLKHQQKDMRLALALGDENAVSMPIAAAANEAFKKARGLGLGDLDFSAVH